MTRPRSKMYHTLRRSETTKIVTENYYNSFDMSAI